MSLKVGDSAFIGLGVPGIVKDKKLVTRETSLTTDPELVKIQHRHGYINGLNLTDREEFNKLMDKIREVEDPQQRVNELYSLMETLNADPNKRELMKYIKAELAHFMYSYGIRPREYTADSTKFY